MSDKSKIEWTDASWNPVVGCTKIAAGCKNCCAERMARRLAGRQESDYASTIKNGHWSGDVFTLEKKLNQPLHWRKSRMIFVCSMSDLFHKDVAFFFKQWGGVNKKKTGRILDGRTWDEYTNR